MIRLLATLLAAVAIAGAAPAQRPGPLVLVDVGHSLSAPGSRSASGVDEFRWNAALAAEVAAALRRRGMAVETPNADGRVASLAARPATAAAHGAALFLSIHHDSVQEWQMPRRDRFSGFSVWTSGSHPAAAASGRCGDAIARSMAAAGMRPNLAHAAVVPGESRILLDARTGRYRRDDLAVLRLSRTPAVLVEAGVIVNPAEEAWLARADVRRGMAEAIADGVRECLR